MGKIYELVVSTFDQVQPIARTAIDPNAGVPRRYHVNSLNHRQLPLIALLCAVLLSPSILCAQQAGIDQQGDATIAGFSAPFSSYASPQARQMFQRVLENGRHSPPLTGPIATNREFNDKINTDRAERMQRLYPVNIETRSLAGVPTQVFTPAKGIDA